MGVLLFGSGSLIVNEASGGVLVLLVVSAGGIRKSGKAFSGGGDGGLLLKKIKGGRSTESQRSRQTSKTCVICVSGGPIEYERCKA